MIVKNEQDVIERVLNSIGTAADEIIVVDTGSTDKTKELARRFTDKVFDFEWTGNFSDARNYSFSLAAADYIMWLDADDVLPPESLKALIKLKKELDADVVMMPYHIAFDESGKATFTYYRERVVRRSTGFKWTDPVHEVIVPAGNIKYAEIPIEHRKLKKSDPLRNLFIYESLIEKGVSLSERQKFYFAGELYYSGNYDLALYSYERFLDGDGDEANKQQTCLNMARIFSIKGDEDAALAILFKSFAYALPSAEILCEIGNILVRQKRYGRAAYWYQTALNSAPPLGIAFKEIDCYGFIPYIQLSLCSYYMGKTEDAARYNDEALKIKPYNKAAQQNKRFYASL